MNNTNTKINKITAENFNFSADNFVKNRYTYTIEQPTNDINKLEVVFNRCEIGKNYKNSLPNLWYKNRYINRVLASWWDVQVYTYDDENKNCSVKTAFNPTIKKHHWEEWIKQINFDFMLEATEENKAILLNEIIKRLNEYNEQTN